MNIVFLDFDGVCTSTTETPGSYLNHAPNEYGPSPNCMSLLIDFCKEENAKIVISSNWRKFDVDGKWKFKDQFVQNPLPKLKKMLGDLCVGTLPTTRHMSKLVALVQWLDVHQDVNNFVVFDDDLNEGFLHAFEHGVSFRFVHVDFKTGLTKENCNEAHRILKGL